MSPKFRFSNRYSASLRKSSFGKHSGFLSASIASRNTSRNNTTSRIFGSGKNVWNCCVATTVQHYIKDMPPGQGNIFERWFPLVKGCNCPKEIYNQRLKWSVLPFFMILLHSALPSRSNLLINEMVELLAVLRIATHTIRSEPT